MLVYYSCQYLTDKEMNEYSEMLKSLRERKEGAFAILSAVSGLSEDRLAEIADGSKPSFTEEMILDALK